MENPIKDAARRTQRYWYVDGLVEMGAGVVILLLALFYWLIRDLAELTLGGVAVGIGQPVIIILGGWVMRKIVQSLKERLTYPRTGYVAYPQPRGKHRLLSLIAFSVLIFFMAAGIVVLLRQLSQNWYPAITGGIFSVTFLYLGIRFGLMRFYLYAIFALLAGLLTSWLRLPGLVDWAFFFTLLGLATIAMGGVILINYLRHTSPAALGGL